MPKKILRRSRIPCNELRLRALQTDEPEMSFGRGIRQRNDGPCLAFELIGRLTAISMSAVAVRTQKAKRQQDAVASLIRA